MEDETGKSIDHKETPYNTWDAILGAGAGTESKIVYLFLWLEIVLSSPSENHCLNEITTMSKNKVTLKEVMTSPQHCLQKELLPCQMPTWYMESPQSAPVYTRRTISPLSSSSFSVEQLSRPLGES